MRQIKRFGIKINKKKSIKYLQNKNKEFII